MRWIIPAVLLSLMSLPVAAQDSEGALILEMRMGSHLAEDASVDVVSDTNAVPMFQLVVGTELAQIPELRLALAYHVKAEQEQPFRLNNLDLEWAWQKVMLTADYGPTLFGFLRPSAKVGLGYSVQYMGLETTSGLFEDYAHDFAYSASLNVEASFLVHQSDSFNLKLGVSTEFGYQGQTTASFDELEKEDSDQWDRRPPVLGDLNTDGLLWSLGIGLMVGF